MKTATRRRPVKPRAAPYNGVYELQAGDHLSQPEFHRLYCQTPDRKGVELIGGIVFVASPTRFQHGHYSGELAFALVTYKAATPGVRAAGDVTVILGPKDEPEPDHVLIIDPAHGGQCEIDKGGYCKGAPELVAEIAYSSVAIDLGLKKNRYQLAGVGEYIVFVVDTGELKWFDFRNDGTITGDAAGVFRSNFFPGLWLDSQALIAGDTAALAATVQRGVATPEHAAFVRNWRSKSAASRPLRYCGASLT